MVEKFTVGDWGVGRQTDILQNDSVLFIIDAFAIYAIL